MASLTGRRRPYVAVQLTLTGGVDRLLTLVNVILAAETGMPTPPMVCPDACGSLTVQNDAATDSGDPPILFGDALLSTSRYGYSLDPNEKKEYRAPLNNIAFGELYALGAMGDKVSVEVMAF